MCGLHGFINGEKREVNADDYVRDGFVAGSLRGTDSCGIASISTKDGLYGWQKLPLPGMYLQGDKLGRALIDDARAANVITICHTRAATVGKIGYATAHPFLVEKGNRSLIGAHNGTLTGWSTKEGAKNFSVDSEWALNHIFNEKFDAFEDFDGAYCFTWWDSDEPGVLNIARNDQRPLYVAITEGNNLAYASEAGMLAWLCERNKIKIVGAIKALSAGFWYKFDVADVTKFTKMELPEKKVVQYNYSHRTDYSVRLNVIDAVKAVIAKAKGEMNEAAPDLEPPATVDLTNKNAVTKQEVEDAVTLQMQGVTGTFIPDLLDVHSEVLYGTFVFPGEEGEISAIMRNAGMVEWSSDSELNVTILGVMDDGRDITAVVGKPRVSLLALSAQQKARKSTASSVH